jgi:hypothetical protein
MAIVDVMVITGLPVVGIISLSPEVGPVAGTVLVPEITQLEGLVQDTLVAEVGQF